MSIAIVYLRSRRSVVIILGLMHVCVPCIGCLHCDSNVCLVGWGGSEEEGDFGCRGAMAEVLVVAGKLVPRDVEFFERFVRSHKL